MFIYNPVHKIVICQACKSGIIPGPRSQERHLRAEPYRLSGNALNITVQLLSNYNLRTIKELKEYKPRPEDNYELIESLPLEMGGFAA